MSKGKNSIANEPLLQEETKSLETYQQLQEQVNAEDGVVMGDIRRQGEIQQDGQRSGGKAQEIDDGRAHAAPCDKREERAVGAPQHGRRDHRERRFFLLRVPRPLFRASPDVLTAIIS